uniref:Uncharacterized protein n=1 Tax=Takifugu rubripes TaxID=31033 RepID=A0A674NQS5_TAKRU
TTTQLKGHKTPKPGVSYVAFCPVSGVSYVAFCPVSGVSYVAFCPVRGVSYVAFCPVSGVSYVAFCPVSGVSYVAFCPVSGGKWLPSHPTERRPPAPQRCLRSHLNPVIIKMESQTSGCVSPLLRCDLPNGRRAPGRLIKSLHDQIKDKQNTLLFQNVQTQKCEGLMSCAKLV